MLVVVAFRATALARFGDVRPRPERLADTVRRVAGRAPEVLLVSWRALVMRRLGERSTLGITSAVARRYALPAVAGLSATLLVAPRGVFALPLVALAVAASTVVLVVALSVDAARRGLALRAACGDDQALGTAVTTALIRRP